MEQKVTLLNPFSVELKKHPFMEVNNRPVYENGDYRIYKYLHEHFIHTYKNIVIAQRCAANTDLINNLIADNKPTDEAALYHQYDRPKKAIADGIKAAKKLNFSVA